MSYDLKKYLPTTLKEVQLRGWNELDVILFSGDVYVDHPSFGVSVIGRVLENANYRVAIVPQPDWRGDGRDFTKLGKPRLFFGVSAGCMDSMVNHYTANRRLRSNDAYSIDGKAGMRPDYCTTTYCQQIRKYFVDVPIVIGGIEASMRRLSHYDYWSDTLMPSILVTSKADLLVYGMGERSMLAIAQEVEKNGKIPHNIPQTAYLTPEKPSNDDAIELYSYEDELTSKEKHALNFRTIEIESNKIQAHTLVQATENQYVTVNPPYPTMTTEELDAIYDLPFQYLPHPKYKNHTIPAYDMIQFSVNIHRGCFGGCSFCTISAHQGKQIVSRSEKNILKQIQKIASLPHYKGYLSDLGGPSANMYGMRGKDLKVCEKCAKPSCIFPQKCNNLDDNFAPLLHLYREVDKLDCVKKAFVSSGIRYDLMTKEYGEELITKHVSGRLKVAPEHIAPNVLTLMRKPSFEKYQTFRTFFYSTCKQKGLNQQLIPYFISSHPGCTEKDMQDLKKWFQKTSYFPEQVQDFTPTPMTLSTTMYYTGINPYTNQKVYVAHSQQDKLKQRSYFAKRK
ncbi:MAG: YgiQ family radical SAM protein [Paludibacteraceae bacterium]|nr:YgiQ family radical SAM protein [Paludibacteraceae bacterium]